MCSLFIQGPFTSLRFSKKADRLVSGSDDGMITIWRIKDWACVSSKPAHKGSITDLDVNPSGKVMISCGRDNNVRLWDMTSSKELYSRSTKGRGYGGFRSCGSVLAAKVSVMHSAMMCPFAAPKVTSALFVSVPAVSLCLPLGNLTVTVV